MSRLTPNFSSNTLEPWLLLDITTECNLRCKHCHLWRTTEGPVALTTEEKIRVLGEFREWKHGGKVVFAGGEAFLKPDEVLRLARHCRDLGLHSTALSNATLLNSDLIDLILQSGLSQLSISLDAPTAEDYDFTRGVSGTFAKTITALRALVEKKQKRKSPVCLTVNTILKRSLLPALAQHMDFVQSLGVDGIFLFPLEATFANSAASDPFYEKERLLPDAAAEEAFEFLLSLRESSGFIGNSREDLLAMRRHIFSGATDHCAAGDRNVIVDLNGNVRFCHLMEEHISDGKILGNVRNGALRELCTTPAASGFREIMYSCREPCASLNCNRPTVQ